MGDSGEGLVDAEARIQEQMEEREADRRRRAKAGDRRSTPSGCAEVESLKLAKAELTRQADATTHPVRKQQISAAIAEIDIERLAAKSGSAQARRRDRCSTWRRLRRVRRAPAPIARGLRFRARRLSRMRDRSAA